MSIPSGKRLTKPYVIYNFYSSALFSESHTICNTQLVLITITIYIILNYDEYTGAFYIIYKQVNSYSIPLVSQVLYFWLLSCNLQRS